MNIHNEIKKIEAAIKQFPVRDFSYENFESKISFHDEVKDFIQKEIIVLEPTLQIRILDEFHGYGPISKLILDEEITEIIINGPHNIWFEKKGKLFEHADSFATELTFSNFVHRICQEGHIHYTLERPMADGKFLDFRIHLVSEELTRAKTVISLRRHPKNPWTLSKLIENNWCTEHEAVSIKKMLGSQENFIVVGGTGTGKTSFLNACLQEIQRNCRAVIIEDTEELAKPNKISTRLLTRKDAQGVLSTIDQSELLKQALRMRPDRIIMGEIRGDEAKDLLMALSTGHQGSFASLHATDAHQALLRLEMLIQLGAPNWSLDAIRNLIFLSLQKIIVIERLQDGTRALKGIYQICSRETSGILIERCT
jgi:pilus assembly protein CpaF